MPCCSSHINATSLPGAEPQPTITCPSPETAKAILSVSAADDVEIAVMPVCLVHRNARLCEDAAVDEPTMTLPSRDTAIAAAETSPGSEPRMLASPVDTHSTA